MSYTKPLENIRTKTCNYQNDCVIRHHYCSSRLTLQALDQTDHLCLSEVCLGDWVLLHHCSKSASQSNNLPSSNWVLNTSSPTPLIVLVSPELCMSVTCWKLYSLTCPKK